MKTIENKRARIRTKNNICGGGPASHIDQGRRSRFPARVLLRPALTDSTQLADLDSNSI